MVELTSIAQPIGELILKVVGTELWIVGVIALLCFLLYAFWFGLDLTVGMLVFVPLLFILMQQGLLPTWLALPAVLIMGVVIAVAVNKYTGRQ